MSDAKDMPEDAAVGPDMGEAANGPSSASSASSSSSSAEKKESSSSDNLANITMTCEPGQRGVLRGVKNQLQVLFSITTPKIEVERPPIQLSAVLDKSGSMQGDCLENSKKAICKLIKHLQPGKDKMHFVVYDTSVTTIFENGNLENKDELKALVKKVRAGTATNLHGGMQQGAVLLGLQEQQRADDHSIRRVFLFSDGLVNAGMTDKNQILKTVDGFVGKGITVSAFGIGSSFDEALMTSIADRGKGDYFFLESAQTIAKHVSKSVHGLMNVVGTETKLKVKGTGGAIVTKVFGYDDASLVKGIDLGDLHSDNVRQVLIDIDVLPEAGSGIEFSLEYCTDKGPCLVKGKCVLELVDDSEMIKPNSSVLVATAIQKNAEIIKRVETLIITDKKAAIKLQREATELLTPVLSLDTTGQVQKVLDRCEKALKRLEEGKEDTEVIRRQYAYEGRLQRKMSLCAYSSGEDSDSDDGGAREGPPPPVSVRRSSLRASPPRRERPRSGSISDDSSPSPSPSPVLPPATAPAKAKKGSFFSMLQRRLS